jgi:transketolase
MRDTFVAALTDIARQDARVVLMTGDLGFGVLTPFAAALPRQFVNVGVAEQNLAGVATGLALSGHIVFTYSIANFPTLRCLEQIRNDACYHDANVKVVAIGGGFSYGALGISHHATEDLAILRSLPGMTVYSPASRVETAAVTRFAYETAGTCYIRLDKSSVDDATTEGDAVVAGRARKLRIGKDATIIGVGGVLEEAMQAANELAREQVECTVLSMHTVKPIDRDAILDACRNTPVVLTVEEHTLDGGLGGAVAEVCMDHGVHPAAFRRIGLKSEFSSVVGSQQYLRSRYGMNARGIADTLRDALRECSPRTDPPTPAPNRSYREP